jgi:hypothetical protein
MQSSLIWGKVSFEIRVTAFNAASLSQLNRPKDISSRFITGELKPTPFGRESDMHSPQGYNEAARPSFIVGRG